MRKPGVKRLRRERMRRWRIGGAAMLLLAIVLAAPALSVGFMAGNVVWALAAAIGLQGLVIDKGCCDCTGKWIAAQAYVNWHGNEPFTSVLGGAVDCVGYPNCPSNPVMGGTKYLTRKIETTHAWTCVSQDWVRVDGVWELHVNTVGYNGHVINETNVNPKSGCNTFGAQLFINDFTHGEFGDGCGCSGFTPDAFFAMVDSVSCAVGGGGTITVQPIGVWTHGFDYRCGAYVGDVGGCGSGFPGGSEADLAAYLFGLDVTFDPVTATSIGVHGVLNGGAGIHHSGTYGPGTPPPDDAPLDAYCAAVDATCAFDSTVTLSNEHNYAALFGLATELLSNYDFRTETWKSFPPQDACIEGGFIAFAGSTLIPLLHYNDTGCCSSGGAPNGNGTDCLPFDESIIHTYVQGVDSFVQLRWGAWIEYTPGNPINTGAITVQKWAMKQGCYLAHDWQDEAAKTWHYLLQEWTANYCSGDATYGCNTETGSANHIICISPNFEYPGSTFNTGFVPERTMGNIWQSVFKDADADKYPGDCYTAAASSDPPCYIEVESCECNCPTADICGPPSLGGCPFVPPDNCDSGC